MNDLTKVMDQTMTSLRTRDEALTVVHGVAEQVTEFVGNYGWKEEQLEQGRQE